MGLTLTTQPLLRLENCGCFVSRGKGMHPERIIASHELIHIEQGELGMFEEKTEFTVRAGESLLLFPGRRHGGTRAYPPELRFYWLHFHLQPPVPPQRRKAASPCGPEDAQGPFALQLAQHCPAGDEERQLWLWRRLLDDQESGRLTPLSAQNLLLLLLEEAARGEERQPEYVLARKIEQRIEAGFHERLSAGSIAGELGYNPDYLARLYRKAYGRTITGGIHLRRLRHAKGLLLGSDFNINEIARESGFADPAQLRKLFLRHEGIPPSRYRALSARLHINTL